MSQTSNSHQRKRLDLQEIRGIAIISVLVYHFVPSLFPNGYVGVDQFFVLSGFLMCMLLRNSSSSLSLPQYILNFYIRRLKRILPAYFLMIFLSMIAVLTIFPLTSIETNVESGKKALIFMSTTDGDDYFTMLSIAINVFTHTWSLSVEVQFYLFIPFIFLFGSKFFREKLEILYYIFLGLSSYIYSIFFCTESEAFNSVLARFWQFSVGMIAFLITDMKQNDELPAGKNNLKETPYLNYFLLALNVFGSFWVLELPAHVLRPFITILTGFLIMNPPTNMKSTLNSKFLVYSGEVSYSLYLIHWPIYAFWKLMLSQGNSWNLELIVALGVSIVLAVISYEFYEKWYLKQSNIIVFIVCCILFAHNALTFYKNSIRPDATQFYGLNKSEIVSFERAAQLNNEWSMNDFAFLRNPTCEYDNDDGYAWGFCRHKGLSNDTRQIKIMIIGNSLAANNARIVFDECGQYAKNLVLYSLGSTVASMGCEPLYTSANLFKKICGPNTEIFEQSVEKEKPDYLFIFSKFFEIGDVPLDMKNIHNDPILKTMNIKIKKLSASVKHEIFIMQQIPRINRLFISKIVDAVRAKQNLTQFDKILTGKEPTIADIRYNVMMSKCPKCQLLDYKSKFFNETTGTWRFYDEENSGLTYITEGQHLSPHGLELIRPIIRNVCEQIGEK